MPDQEIIPEETQEVSAAETEETPDVETEATESEAPEEVEAHDEEGAADPDEEGSEDDGDDEEPEEFELKIGGQVLKVPTGAMPENVRDQVQKFVNSAETSYTQKFQELAESRKAMQERVTDLDVLDDLLGSHQDLIAHGRFLNNEIARLQKIDLNRLWHENPDQARQTSDRLAALQRDAQAIGSQVSQAEQSIRQKKEAHLQTVREQGKQMISKVAKDFKPDPVIDHAVALFGEVGMPLTREQASADWSLNPALAVAMHESMLWRQQQARTKQMGTRTPKAVEQPIKTPKGKGASKGTVNPDRMTTEQWMKWRQEDLRKKGKLF